MLRIENAYITYRVIRTIIYSKITAALYLWHIPRKMSKCLQHILFVNSCINFNVFRSILAENSIFCYTLWISYTCSPCSTKSAKSPDLAICYNISNLHKITQCNIILGSIKYLQITGTNKHNIKCNTSTVIRVQIY